MNKIQIFKNPKFGEIRVTGTPDKPMFCLLDVCNALDIKNARDCKSRLRTPGVGIADVGVQTGTKADGTPAIQFIKMTFIDEGNLYKCIFQSRKKEAEQFQDWVTDKVLPTIRKTGSYSLTTPSYQISDPIKRAEQWIAEEKARQKLAAENAAQQKLLEEQKPKVTLADTITAKADSIPVNMLAKFMAQKGYDVGEVRLFKYLRENGYMGRRGNHANVPCQRYIEMGLFEIEESTDGEYTSIVPKVTGKGQLYFINKFIEGKIPKYKPKVWKPKNTKRNFGAYNYTD